MQNQNYKEKLRNRTKCMCTWHHLPFHHADCIIMLCRLPYIFIYLCFVKIQYIIVIVQRVILHKHCSYTYTYLFNIDYCINIYLLFNCFEYYILLYTLFPVLYNIVILLCLHIGPLSCKKIVKSCY